MMNGGALAAIVIALMDFSIALEAHARTSRVRLFNLLIIIILEIIKENTLHI